MSDLPSETSGRVPQEDRSGGDEAGIVRRAAQGDLEAYEMLYHQHVGRVHALCLRMARDPSEAEELTQQAFIRVWERLPGFRGDAAIATWIHRVAVNVVVDAMRSRGRWRQRFTALEPESVESPAAPEGSDLDLERAIAGLSPKARLVFVLHDVEGYKHEEIAHMTGIAVGTSKAHLHRARRLLREELSA